MVDGKGEWAPWKVFFLLIAGTVFLFSSGNHVKKRSMPESLRISSDLGAEKLV